MTWTAGRKDDALLRQLQRKHPERVTVTAMFPKPAPRHKHRWNALRWTKFKVERECVDCAARKEVARDLKPIRKVSKKRARQLRSYPEFRRRIAKLDGGCVACLNGWGWCGPQAWLEPFEIDHVDGRRGANLLDESNAVQLHRSGHQFKTDHAREARKQLRPYLWARRMRMLSFGGIDTGSVPGVRAGITKEVTPHGKQEPEGEGSRTEGEGSPAGEGGASHGVPGREGPPHPGSS